MNLLVQTLLTTLVAAFGFAHDRMDSTMRNRPIVVTPLADLVLRDIRTRIMTGTTLELIWLGVFPVGASCPSRMVSGAIIETSFVINSGGEPNATVALAVPVAILTSMIRTELKVPITSPVFCGHADRCAAAGDVRGVERTETIGWVFEIVFLFTIIAVSYYLGTPLIRDIVTTIPPFINHRLEIATNIIPAIGFAMLVRMTISKDVTTFFFGGFLLSAYLEIPIFGVALMTCVIVGVTLTIKQISNNKISEEMLSDEGGF